MYVAILILLIACALGLFLWGAGRRKLGLMGAGAVLALSTWAFFWFLGFWGEYLWFEAVAYDQRFWTEFLTKVACGAAGGSGGGAVVVLLTSGITVKRWYHRAPPVVIGAYVGGSIGVLHWDTVLRFMNRVETGVAEPVLGHDTGFYLFVLPFLDAAHSYAISLVIIGILAIPVAIITGRAKIERGSLTLTEPEKSEFENPTVINSLYLAVGLLLLIMAAGVYLNRFHTMYSETGVVTGPGWTDVHIRIPAYLIVSIVIAISAIVLAVPYFRGKMSVWLPYTPRTTLGGKFVPAGAAAALIVCVWILGLGLAPALTQWLRVEPNEITLERPYIENNIAFTRQGFKLDRVDQREFAASPEFNQDVVDDYSHIIENVRLWDWRALKAVHKQFQEIRLYYEFNDVDIDRYMIGDDYRQLMASAREMEIDNLPERSQTFVNQRFKYTHGYGLTLTPVHDFTPQGLPNFLVKDIPPQSRVDDLDVTRPEIYYGELTDSYVVVNSREEEFDYPRGEQNEYVRYAGNGGVKLENSWRKFVYGWRFDGTRFFLSSYPRPESRIMFHRRIRERLETLVPFLHFDKDPYIVLSEGQLYWIVDAYTSSEMYPYSEGLYRAVQTQRSRVGAVSDQSVSELAHLAEANYLRNSVKAVVNAYDGSVDFYVYEPDDPLIKVWRRIFPDMFQDRENMPESLQAHVRYPADMLLAQGLVYAKYHMTDPAVFYNQEDLWVRATEKYYNQVRPVEPYYIMWEPPGSKEAEYVLMLPFTPKNRQVLIGWIAGMCDGEKYGDFLAYQFPKEKRILGTQQVETKIDQDPYLSGQLTLWDQRGSNVIRGNVLAIPIGKTLLYVEPIYLQAETAAYPELRLVALMHDDRLSYAETFAEALRGLLEEGAPPRPRVGEPEAAPESLRELITRANDAFENYLSGLSEKRFSEASQALETLEQTLNQLNQEHGMPQDEN